MIAPAQCLTLRTLVERHYLPFIDGRASAGTLADYRAALNAWQSFGKPASDASQLYGADFNAFVKSAADSGKAPHTINKWLRVYRAAFRFAFDEGLVCRVPVMRPVACDEQIKWRPTLDELSRLHRACRVAKWPDRAGGPVVWWRAFLVLSYVGALRRSDVLNRLRWDQVQPDGIHGRRQKRKRLTFVPMLACVRSHLDALTPEAGSKYILPCPSGPRQFRVAMEAVGDAAGIPEFHENKTHAIKRTATDEWFQADPSGTAGHIISHARQSVTIRSYLDRVRWLTTVAPNLAIPEAFGKQPQRDDDAAFLAMFKRLSAKDRESVRAIAERFAG